MRPLDEDRNRARAGVAEEALMWTLSARARRERERDNDERLSSKLVGRGCAFGSPFVRPAGAAGRQP
jgi:hypothetical protein